jgi:hypothetical protein
MNMDTNITNVLATAEQDKIDGSLRVMSFVLGGNVPGLYVRYEGDNDYITFDNSNETPFDEFKIKYNAVEYLVGENPATKKNALHIKINSSFRKKLKPFYEDLCLNFDSSDTDGSVWRVIDEYAYLWTIIREDKLSYEKEVGLFGELIVLGELLDAGDSTALNQWKGPEDGLHDFVKDGDWELEVKTSVSPNPIVKVHPVTQLEPIGTPFHLVVVKLKGDRVNGSSLPEMVAEVDSKLPNSGDKDKFETLLGEVGYFSIDATKYTNKFSPIESLKYKIDENTDILCPLTIGSKAKYHSIRWKLLVSDYTMVECEPEFWRNPI